MANLITENPLTTAPRPLILRPALLYAEREEYGTRRGLGFFSSTGGVFTPLTQRTTCEQIMLLMPIGYGSSSNSNNGNTLPYILVSCKKFWHES